MSVHAPTREAKHRPQPQTLQSNVMPAPISGMDGRLNLASNDPTNCIFAYNLVPSEYGMRTRAGYREWQIDIETAPDMGLGVRTVIPYHGIDEVQATDKLFATTNEGIWDVTAYNVPPVLVQAFADITDAAGWGVYSHYTDDSGTVILYLADSANGLFAYDPVLDSWAPATNITGPVIADIVFVVVHKQRIWLVEKDTTKAWYLPVGSSTGVAREFFFGSKFKHGGDLVGLYNWTLDSGSGVDDILIAVSRAGDVLPWRGADPSAAVSWENIGTFYVGDIPLGRRVASEYGGDLRLLSDFGLISMSDLLTGVAGTNTADSISLKIARFIRSDMTTYGQSRGWEIKFNSSEGTLLIGTPRRTNGQYLQYRVNFSVEGWAFWRDVPMVTADTWHGALMFGTEDNRVMRMDVDVDNSTIAEPAGHPIPFSMLFNYFDMDAPGIFKFGEFIRANWLSDTKPAWYTRFLYDYTNQELPLPIPDADNPESSWDNALWDQAVWSSEELESFFTLQGSWGPGRTMAVAVRGNSISRATLVSADVLWRNGGPF